MSRKRLLPIISLLVSLTFLLQVVASAAFGLSPNSSETHNIHSEEKNLFGLNASELSTIYLPLSSHQFGLLPPVIPDTTKVLTAESTQYLESVSVDLTVFTFSQPTFELMDLNPGDVIVSSVSEAAPYGFLRRIVSISNVGGYIVIETEFASLEDAIEQGSVRLSQNLTPDMVVNNQGLEGVSLLSASPDSPLGQFYLKINDVILLDKDNNPNTTGDRILANGSIAIDPTFILDLDLKGRKLKYFNLKIQALETSQLTISSSFGMTVEMLKITLATYRLTPLTVMIGPVPIVITPILTISTGIDGHVEFDMVAGVTQEASLEGGIKYADSDWSIIGGSTNQFGFVQPNFGNSVTIKGYTGAELALRLYGITGVKAEINAILELESDLVDSPWWALYGGLEVPVGVDMKIVSKVVADFKATIIEYKTLIAQSFSLEPPGDFQKLSPPQGAAGQSTSLTLDWGDSNGAGTYQYCYDTSNDNACSNWISTGTTSQATLSGLAKNTTYYWHVRATNLTGTTYANESAAAFWNFTTSETTEVIKFYPTGISGTPSTGYCWTNSSVLVRRDAWRCNDSGGIQDPCISPIGETGYVVCGAHPIYRPVGYRLYLTQPLPEPLPPADIEEVYAWAMELFDNSTCSLVVASTWPTCLPLYGCTDGLSLKTYPTSGILWTAERGIFSEETCLLSEVETSPLKTIWK
jgi:hypothetical protein